MPELPEVEVVRATLEEQLKGLTITRVECLYEPIIENTAYFIKQVEHQAILEIKRYAKYLIFIHASGTILSHLRMEGKYFYVPQDFPIDKHQHVIFYLDNGFKLIYQDVRKFGRILYKPLEELYTTPPLSKLGIEANVKEFPLDVLYQKLQTKHLPIKSVLLDQSFISGLGNIYVDEVLYQAHIRPTRKSSSIKKKELAEILLASQSILDEAIKHKGTTIRSYTSSLGVSGQHQNYLMVHTKTTCPFCNINLTILKIGGRTNYYCKKCQR